jgi:ADP-ribosylglycohydrolase
MFPGGVPALEKGEKMSFLHRVQECLKGVAYGDALGMPVEMMTPAEIIEATGGKGVTDFIDPVQRRIKGTMTLSAGDTTDDWQLTKAVAESLIEKRRFDIDDLAARHIEAFRANTFGWGGTTKRGIESLISGRDPRDPPPSSNKGGCGNGVAMKVAPLALFHAVQEGAIDPKALLAETVSLGRLTHPDPRASIAAYALAAAIIRAVRKPILNEGGHAMREERKRFLSRVAVDAGQAEARLDPDRMPPSQWVSQRLWFAEQCLDDPVAMRETVGTGCIAIESVPFAIGTFVRHSDSFRDGLLEAVNAGGDADSTASMAGALIGANGAGQSYTARCVPLDWEQRFPRLAAEAMELGERLYEAARK